MPTNLCHPWLAGCRFEGEGLDAQNPAGQLLDDLHQAVFNNIGRLMDDPDAGEAGGLNYLEITLLRDSMGHT